MARPYSWLEYPMTTLVTKTNEANSLELEAADGLKSSSILLLWGGLCWWLEAEHKHSNRPPISRKISNIAFAAATAIGAVINPKTLVISAVHYAASILYSKKEGKRDFLGATSFLVRGIGQGALFFFSQYLYSPALNTRHFLMGLAVAGMTAARNLIGDLRDQKYDEKTFNKRFGERAGRFVASGLKLGAAAAVFFATGSVFVSAPLLIESVLSLVHKNNQHLHRISVLGVSATLGNIVLANIGLGAGMILTNLLYVSGLLNIITYNMVPRESNQDYNE